MELTTTSPFGDGGRRFHRGIVDLKRVLETQWPLERFDRDLFSIEQVLSLVHSTRFRPREEDPASS